MHATRISCQELNSIFESLLKSLFIVSGPSLKIIFGLSITLVKTNLGALLLSIY